MDGQERRQYPRLSLSVYVGCEIMGKLDPVITTAPSKDVSSGGIRIILLDMFETGTLLKLKFLLPGEEGIITATGQIAWITEASEGGENLKKAYDAGIKFIYIDSADSRKITGYVQKSA